MKAADTPTRADENLVSLPNIGKTLAAKLKAINIADAGSLIKEGSQNAFLKIKSNGGSPCYSMLCALEGAIRGTRWHDLPMGVKLELKSFFESVKY